MYWKPSIPLVIAADQEIKGIGAQPADIVRVGIGNPHIDLLDAYVQRTTPKPHAVLNTGTAGGMGDTPGSIFVIDKVVDGTSQGRDPIELAVPEWAQDLPRRTVATVDHIVDDPAEHEALKAHAQLVDMELYDLAVRCQALGVELYSVKIVSDGADDGAYTTWLLVAEKISQQLGAYLRKQIG
ncbi:hypothetical protein [Stomatohabitans albus]|uniref:phosphorylase family protein n=1 Tax=Stomatohabitans albus TaxID=3110766 RepID=UPI00300CD246